MANIVTNCCRRIRVSPAQKATLMALADYADASGRSWPSIPSLCEWTCLGRTAVIEALRALTTLGLVDIERTHGASNRYAVRVDAIGVAEVADDQSAGRTCPLDGPVRQTDVHPSASRTTPVRETDATSPPGEPNTPGHTTEPSKDTKRTRVRAATRDSTLDPAELFPEVDRQLLGDWITAVRKTKRAGPLTETAASAVRREAKLADISVESAIRVCVERSWVGFRADWYRNTPQASTAKRGKHALRNRDYDKGIENGQLI